MLVEPTGLMQRAFIGLFLDGIGKMTCAWAIFEQLQRTDLASSVAITHREEA